MDTFDEALEIAVKSGFDFIEIGVPFSDPVADGPIIAKASWEAIKKGVTLNLILEYLERKNLGKTTELYIMTYSNIIWSLGPKKVSERLEKCGVKGCIIADLPNEEHSFFRNTGFSLPIVKFATPESRDDDLVKLIEVEEGFIYFVSVRGTTGGSFHIDHDTERKLLFLKEKAKVPVILGFGIRNKKDVERALSLAHGFVIGTKAVEILEKGVNAFKSWCEEIARL